MNSPLLILGASTRAAAFSALRAGFHPVCGDMYADADLRRFATVIGVPSYPQGLAAATRALPPMPWVYTGALENWPNQIEGVSKRHRLLGAGRAVLKSCRDPWFLKQIFEQHGFATLNLCSTSAPPPRDGSWLRKPIRSSAGRAISRWNDESSGMEERHYFQQFQTGFPISASFLGMTDATGAHSAELLGVSGQLIGVPELHAPELGYCGSVVPGRIEDLWSAVNWDSVGLTPSAPSASPIHEELCRLGKILANHCGLPGLFGVDLIWNGATLYPLEVNPRFTASMELLEHSLKQPLLGWHMRACQGNLGGNAAAKLQDEIRAAVRLAGSREIYCAKVILYANRSAGAPDLSDFIPQEVLLGSLPTIADIPTPGSQIQPGQPVFSCLTQGIQSKDSIMEAVTRAQSLWGGFR